MNSTSCVCVINYNVSYPYLSSEVCVSYYFVVLESETYSIYNFVLTRPCGRSNLVGKKLSRKYKYLLNLFRLKYVFTQVFHLLNEIRHNKYYETSVN